MGENRRETLLFGATRDSKGRRWTVGDKAKHPVYTGNPETEILWIGNRTGLFVHPSYIKAYRRGMTFGYSAIEGSPWYKLLVEQRYIKVKEEQVEPSAEIDYNKSIMDARLVIPLSELDPVKKVE